MSSSPECCVGWDKIDAPDAATVLDLVAEVTGDLRESPGRPQFLRVAPPVGHGAGEVRGSPGRHSGRQSGPESRRYPGGVRCPGDWKSVRFHPRLRAKKPRDEVKVKVLRNGQPLEVSVVLARRE